MDFTTSEADDRSKPFDFDVTHRDLIHQVAFDHHGRRLATCSSDMTLSVWDRTPEGTWIKAASWKVHGGAVWRVVWAHPEFGQLLATCSYDRSVHIWEEIRSAPGAEGRKGARWVRKAYLTDSRANVTDIAFAPRHLGLMLATVSAQGIVRIYEAADVMDLSRCGSVEWSRSRIHRPLLAVASDDKRAENDERIVIYEHNENLRKWQRVISLRLDLAFPVTDLRFSPIALADSHQLAVAAGDVHVYNIKIPVSAFVDDDNGTPENVPTDATEYSANKVAVLGDERHAWRIKYNVTGTALTASSGDGTVRVWKAMFVNQWALLAEMSSEDYLEERELLKVKGVLSETGRGDGEAYHRRTYY
ncbi:WD domain, G-beta repeat protein [Ancylostoma ceylanicum]|uniref:WD domain, G-beta repeat protein n=1 Tax=Ancylostoma ceylanicum TaxID=53326 RepID=A0A0D6LM49_9BILA|nr:WD domain, G-beta repeat protein [Ancylostoma ceylanicum]